MTAPDWLRELATRHPAVAAAVRTAEAMGADQATLMRFVIETIVAHEECVLERFAEHVAVGPLPIIIVRGGDE